VTAIQVVSAVLLALGGIVMLGGATGVVRFPDFYTRLHAGGKSDTLGAALILIGLALPLGLDLISLKLLLIVVFVFIFNPTATHALARGAWLSGVVPWTKAQGEPRTEHEDDDDDLGKDHV
jgi:multicomponent Na+:H+ antiporter subunit G